MPVPGGRGVFRPTEFYVPARDASLLPITGSGDITQLILLAATGLEIFAGSAAVTQAYGIAGLGTVVNPTVVVVAVGGRPRHHPGRRKRKRVEAEVQALAAELTAPPAPWEVDDETVLDLLLLDVL